MSELHLARISVDPRSRFGRRSLADVVEMHRSVMAAFPQVPGDSARAALGVLYRVENDARPAVLVQARVVPETAGLPQGFHLEGVRPLEVHCEQGDLVRYRIVANTVMSRHVPGERGKPVAVPARHAASWWAERAARAGLRLEADPVAVDASNGGRRKGRPITFCGTRFDGIAVVEDPDALEEAIESGIGRAKAYGYGLLSVVRVRR